MTALPQWIDPEAWEGYSAMRRMMKKPMTPRAEALVLKTLFKLKEWGHDPNAALDQSTVHNWIDVYEPKTKEIANLKPKEMKREPARTPEQLAADEAGYERVMAKLRPAIKLVRAA